MALVDSAAVNPGMGRSTHRLDRRRKNDGVQFSACSGRLPRHPAASEAGATVPRLHTLHTRMPGLAVLRSFLVLPGARWSRWEQRAGGRLSDPGQLRRQTSSIGCSCRRRPPPARRRGRAVQERAEAAGSSGAPVTPDASSGAEKISRCGRVWPPSATLVASLAERSVRIRLVRSCRALHCWP
jgi:hypothetical protein